MHSLLVVGVFAAMVLAPCLAAMSSGVEAAEDGAELGSAERPEQ